jgi:hypothetical protein
MPASGVPASGKPASGLPAKGYSWPPFEPGNEVSLRHGARSDRFVEPLARAFADALLTDRPDLAAYPEALMAWSTSEARCERLRVWTAEHGLVGEDGKVVNSHDILMFEAQAAKFRALMGLDPMSDAQLQKTRADAVLTVVDLESIRARGREALARRQALAAAEDAEGVEIETVEDDRA